MPACVGCGYCCIKTLCDVARRLYPNVKNCPQLEWDEKDNRYYCNLMRLAGPLGENYRKELFAGAGCCCSLNSWRENVQRRVIDLKRTLLNPIPDIMQMFIRLLARNFIGADAISLILRGMENEMLEKDYAEEEIKLVIKSIKHIFDENRSSFMKGFMG